MMAILIKDMAMPKSCGYCPLRHEAKDGDECYLGASLTEYQKRPDDCPLVEIPQHGDLIDREALMDDIIGSMVFSGRNVPKEAAIVQKVLDIVGDANAIIPAEEGET